jgi:hypothetical protein
MWTGISLLKGSVHSAFQYEVNCIGAAKAFGSDTGQARQLFGRHGPSWQRQTHDNWSPFVSG